MQTRRRLLGELLVEAGLIYPWQLEKALVIQEDTKERIGKILIALGYLDEYGLIKGLSLQFGMESIALKGMTVSTEVLTLLPAGLAKQYCVFPLANEEKTLHLAVSDPTDFYAVDAVKAVCSFEIVTVLAPLSEIKQCIEECYGMQDLPDKKLRFDNGAGNKKEERLSYAEVSAVEVVDMIIVRAAIERASDIHIEPFSEVLRIRFRIDGILREYYSFSTKVQAAIVSRLKVMSSLDIVERRMPQDGRIHYVYEKEEIDLRVAVIPTIFGEKIVIRVLRKERLPVTIRNLGFSLGKQKLYEEICQRTQGMVLITGTTGSGKTTTLYATLKKINDATKNIVTIENPVEYRLHGMTQIQINEKIGLSFAVCLRAVLRQDPDVIMVGEIRDHETADIAVRAALTGRLIFSTLHTSDAVSAVFRLLDMGIRPFLLASSLAGIVAQRLVRVICPQCKKPYHPSNEEERRLLGDRYTETLVLYKGTGCQYCGGTGYTGRTAVIEILPLNAAIRTAFLSDCDKNTLRHLLDEQCGESMHKEAMGKVLQGVTTLEEVIRVV